MEVCKSWYVILNWAMKFHLFNDVFPSTQYRIAGYDCKSIPQILTFSKTLTSCSIKQTTKELTLKPALTHPLLPSHKIQTSLKSHVFFVRHFVIYFICNYFNLMKISSFSIYQTTIKEVTVMNLKILLPLQDFWYQKESWDQAPWKFFLSKPWSV